MTKKLAAKAAPKKKATVKVSDPQEKDSVNDALSELVSAMFGEQPSAEDVKALRRSLEMSSAKGMLGDGDDDAKSEAQELAFEAMEARSETVARRLAKRALRLDPDCVDALLVLADVGGRTLRARIEAVQGAVAAGRRSLGERFFKKNKGHFWMLIETRPFMRAMETLGGELFAAGLQADAIGVYAEMLELNPNDNQGVRDPLLGLYLALGDTAGAKSLLKQYKDDASACFAWGRVLERLVAGDSKGADAALAKAMRTNRFVALQLVGRVDLPDELPEMYSPGSVEEAVLCQLHLGSAWLAHPESLAWLYGRCAEMGIGPVPSKEGLLRMKTPGKGVQ
jgi:tetratricopeptide (TPR) repeat protein